MSTPISNPISNYESPVFKNEVENSAMVWGAISTVLLVIGYYVGIAALFQTGHISFTGAMLVGALPILLLSIPLCLK